MKTKLFRRKALANAVLVGLAGAAGGLTPITPAKAVHVNPDGLGQVLVNPYFTVRGGKNTLISIVNTTNRVKAMKVRFLDFKNSVEVLDFNLYLSPFDMWVGALSLGSGGTTLLVAPDNSCTVPDIPDAGVAFRTNLLAFDIAGADPDRTLEGHLEIIEMGEVVPGETDLAAAATHGAGGVPTNCPALVAAWTPPAGVWLQNGLADVSVPTGGVFGGVTLIDVDEGTDFSYDSVALDSFSDRAQHSAPAFTTPSLVSASPPFSIVFADGVDPGVLPGSVTTFWDPADNTFADPVSAVFMHQSIMNEFVLDAVTNSGTDWVVTFPTKRSYVNTLPDAFPPFTQLFDVQGACEPINLNFFNREELTTTTPIDFSPSQGGATPLLCWQTNVITFNNTDVLESPHSLNVDTTGVGFQNGWMQIDFFLPLPNSPLSAHRLTSTVTGEVYNGLPATGFAVQTFENGDVGGLMSNYGGLFKHRGIISGTLIEDATL